MQWIFLGDAPYEQLRLPIAFFNIAFCVCVVAGYLHVARKVLQWKIQKFRFSLITLLLFVTTCPIFLMIFFSSFRHHWFGISIRWSNYFLMWSLNAITSIGVMCMLFIVVSKFYSLIAHQVVASPGGSKRGNGNKKRNKKEQKTGPV